MAKKTESGAPGKDTKEQAKKSTTKNKKRITKKVTKGKGRPNNNKGKIPTEVRALVVMAILTGSYEEDKDIAAETGVSQATISRIKSELYEMVPPESVELAKSVKKNRIGNLVAKHLEKSLESLIRIDAITEDLEWLKRQDAQQLSLFYGVKSDKLVRILQAAERANLES